MNRDKLVERFEKETGLKFTPEYVVYNEYTNWLEQNVVKLFAIPVVSESIIADIIERRKEWRKSRHTNEIEVKQIYARINECGQIIQLIADRYSR